MKQWSLPDMKAAARVIFAKAVAAVDPYEKIRERLRKDGSRLVCASDGRETAFDLDGFERIFLIGAGKASASMAQAVEEILGDRITRGVITTKYGHGLPLRRTEVIEAGHPLPDASGVRGAERICGLLEGSGPRDLILFLLSGGASALLPLPAEGITLEEKQQVTQLLIDCGAEIREINAVRKHISRIKGGRLARRAYPSAVLGLILSDVVGDPLDVIGSGPIVPDTSTFEDAWAILDGFHLLPKTPLTVRRHLQLGREGRIEETPKPGDPAFEKIWPVLIGSSLIALEAAAAEARSLGFNTLILSSSVVGETREAVRLHAAVAREIGRSGNPAPVPACILSGGETTVTLQGTGKGGRNQEFALAGAIEIDGLAQTVLLSGGTDGTDGPTDAAGAVADHTTAARARSAGLDPKAHLKNNDAYPFFQRLEDLLLTGPTRTNVMDVHVLLVA